MSIKQNGGVFGRNPTFNDVTIDSLLVNGNATISDDATSTLRLSNSNTVLTQNQITGQLEFYQSDASGSGTGITGKIGMRSVPQKTGSASYYGNVADMDFYVSGNINGQASDNASLKAMTIQAGLGNVGIGTDLPNASALLDVQSTTKGVRFPNMTTTQKNAMADVAGMQVFDTTLGKMCFNTGSAWETITSS